MIPENKFKILIEENILEENNWITLLTNSLKTKITFNTALIICNLVIKKGSTVQVPIIRGIIDELKFIVFHIHELYKLNLPVEQQLLSAILVEKLKQFKEIWDKTGEVFGRSKKINL